MNRIVLLEWCLCAIPHLCLIPRWYAVPPLRLIPRLRVLQNQGLQNPGMLPRCCELPSQLLPSCRVYLNDHSVAAPHSQRQAVARIRFEKQRSVLLERSERPLTETAPLQRILLQCQYQKHQSLFERLRLPSHSPVSVFWSSYPFEARTLRYHPLPRFLLKAAELQPVAPELLQPAV